MQREWNRLQALILKECPYAYYIRCFAHQLQLGLVAASIDVTERNDQLHAAQIKDISHLTEIGKLESGKGANQIRSLQRSGDTRWGSHFRSICSLMKLYGPAIVVLNNIAIEGSTTSQNGDATLALSHILSFDFVIVLHLMKKIMEITNKVCNHLQKKSQDILNALTLVDTTKMLIQKLRDDGWQSLLNEFLCFCETNEILVPDTNRTYREIIRSHRKKDDVIVEHHYRVDVFIVAIDRQLQELNSRFNETTTELLRISVALDPRKTFKIDDICKLMEKYYPSDFTNQEKIKLKFELPHYKLDVCNHPELKKYVCTLSELSGGLQETRKSGVYPLVDRLICLILTLPVSMATTERAFSAMKIMKTRLRNIMSDDYLKKQFGS